MGRICLHFEVQKREIGRRKLGSAAHGMATGFDASAMRTKKPQFNGALMFSEYGSAIEAKNEPHRCRVAFK